MATHTSVQWSELFSDFETAPNVLNFDDQRKYINSARVPTGTNKVIAIS